MIVACPECSRPFELADDQIAALVQLECPHCSFRMILDFEAANDPSLVEEGMQMASGWRSAADYHASVHASVHAAEPEAASARPHLVPAPEPELEPEPKPVLEPEPIVLTRPGRVAATSPASAPAGSRPASYEARPPAFEAEETRIHEPAAEAKTVIDVPSRPEVSEDAPTVAPPSSTPVPKIEVRLDASMEEDEGPTQIHTPSLKPQAQAPRTSDVVVRKQVVVAAAAEEVPARASGSASTAEARVPPHTPPGRPVVEDAAPAVPQRDTPRPRPAPRFESMNLPDEDEAPKKSSVLGTIVVIVLLLSALGLVGASLALESTWDPRPLLEKVYRQQFK